MKKLWNNISQIAAITIILLCVVAVPVLFISAFVLDSMAADVTYGVLNSQTKTCADMGDGTCAEVTASRTQFFAAVGTQDLSVTTFYILIDLSDTTNYPHTETTTLVLTSCDLEIVATGLEWRIGMGPVTDITANTITIKGVKAITAGIISFDARAAIKFPASGVSQNNLAAADFEIPGITIGTDLASPAGTTNAEVGDILVFVEEISGTSTATFGAAATYWTK